MSGPVRVLGYRETCPRCRFLSLLAVVASLGRIRRVPLSRLAEALPIAPLPGEVAARLPSSGPVYYDGGRLYVGWEAVQAVHCTVVGGRLAQ